jgi:hypothetical protein
MANYHKKINVNKLLNNIPLQVKEKAETILEPKQQSNSLKGFLDTRNAEWIYFLTIRNTYTKDDKKCGTNGPVPGNKKILAL